MRRKRAMKALPFDVSLRDALGERFRVLPADCAPYAIAGVTPTAVALPHDEHEAALALQAANAEGAVVAIRGAGTKSRRPPPPRAIDVAIDTTALAGIVQHAAADLTVTVRAGTTLAALEHALAEAGQFWPCDAPFAESATVGGTIAANANGALRLRYGALRESVLGMRILGPDGTAARSGSRVVKSVAGYDLHKLMAGSFGTLGLIAEVTLKVAPRPEMERIAVARFSSAVTACSVSRQIAGSCLFPMAIALLDEKTARRIGGLLVHASADAWLLLVRCGGNRKAVERQTSDVAAACTNAGAQATACIDERSCERVWAGVREAFGGAPYAGDPYAAVKIACLPTQVAAAIDAVRVRWPAAEIAAQPAAGIVFANVRLSEDDGLDAVSPPNGAGFLTSCARAGWNATVVAAPPAWPERPSAVSALPLPTGLLRSVKAAFDPAGVFDPGRMPGGV